MKRKRKTKILATVGPVSDTIEKIEDLFLTGADAFRINMSHTNHAKLKSLVEIIRKIEKKYQKSSAIVVDLQGPKLRIGSFKKTHINLLEGELFVIDNKDKLGDEKRVYCPHKNIIRCVKKDQLVFLDDAKISMQVVNTDNDMLVCKVLNGGKLSSNKGLSLPNCNLPLNPITTKDQNDLDAALKLDIDWIALSFVQSAEDIILAKKIVGDKAAVLAKIERPQAVDNINEIVEVADGIMVARGDLGVEMPSQKVPGIQKLVTRIARKKGIPIIIATQMLESMIYSPIPTRAEVSDIATAVIDGADSLMLSAESASGNYPKKAVKIMSEIISEVENDCHFDSYMGLTKTHPNHNTPDAICAAATVISKTINITAITCFTCSGTTGLRVSRERPIAPILALSPNIKVNRRLSISWGVQCIQTEDIDSLDSMVTKSCKIARQEKFAKSGDSILIMAGTPFGTPGATNLLKIADLS